jgi:hypothetical protein
MNFGIGLYGVARCIITLSSRARAQDYVPMGTTLGAKGEMFTIASRIPLSITTPEMLTITGER